MKTWNEIQNKMRGLRILQRGSIKRHDVAEAQLIEAEIRVLRWVLDIS